ncbi:hypothetical protein [Candidatus Fukatsuia symbiotica]|nr:hypothetical protein [Candidatus Fukatsuia symbiotica]
MAMSKKPRKRKPSRQSSAPLPPRYLVSIPHSYGHIDDDVDETWFADIDRVIHHCLTFGPQFFLDMGEYPPTTIIIDAVRRDGSGVNLSKMPLDIFMEAVKSGQQTVHYGPWSPDYDAWHD